MDGVGGLPCSWKEITHGLAGQGWGRAKRKTRPQHYKSGWMVDWLIEKAARADGTHFRRKVRKPHADMQGHGVATLFLAAVSKRERNDDLYSGKSSPGVSPARSKYMSKRKVNPPREAGSHPSKVDGHDSTRISADVIPNSGAQAAENTRNSRPTGPQRCSGILENRRGESRMQWPGGRGRQKRTAPVGTAPPRINRLPRGHSLAVTDPNSPRYVRRMNCENVGFNYFYTQVSIGHTIQFGPRCAHPLLLRPCVV